MITRLSALRVVALVTFTALGACSHINQPEGSARVLVADAVAQFDASTRWVGVLLDLTIQNTGTSSVWYLACDNHLQRILAADTVAVWSSVCPAGSGEVEISPGGEYASVLRVTAQLGAGISELWEAPIAGDYRLGVNLRGRQALLPSSSLFSDVFRIEPR
jgi:hypothetical protein